MRILVVEDETLIAKTIRTGLVAEGYAVDVAVDGAEGLWYATENPYDVVILDIMLPKIDGFELCRSIREAKIWSPILMLTARTAESDEATALDLGADEDFFDDIFRGRDLATVVVDLAVLGRTASSVADEVELGEGLQGVLQSRQSGLVLPANGVQVEQERDTDLLAGFVDAHHQRVVEVEPDLVFAEALENRA